MPTTATPGAAPSPRTSLPTCSGCPCRSPSDALRAVNVYVLRDGDRLTLVDGGWTLTVARELLVAALDRLGAELRDIARFLVTHMHRDHYTQAAALRRETGAHVALGAGRAGLARADGDRPVADGRPAAPALRAAGAERAGRRAGADLIPASAEEDLADYALPDRWLADGDRVTVGDRVLEAVETPGHTRGHLVFDTGRSAAGRCSSPATTCCPTSRPRSGSSPPPAPAPLTRFLASLARVRDRPDRRLLPAHGPRPPERARPGRRAARPPRRAPRRDRAGRRRRARPRRPTPRPP